MSPHRRVILLVEAASAYGRGCLRGIARYARAHGQWVFFHGARFVVDPPSLREMRAWKADGLIVRIENARIARIVRQLGLPVVDIRGPLTRPGVCGVFTDDRKVIEMAAGHLMSNGLVHLGFCGYPGIDYSDSREAIFNQTIDDPRIDKHVFAGPGTVSDASYEQRGVKDAAALRAWLRKLPKPAGVIACNDTRGRQVLQACVAAGIKVPYEVSVVGVDDDDVVCELSYPTMTSVAPNVETVGFEAAQLLERLLSGETPPPEPLLIAPVGIEVRGSSDVMALSDPMLVQAVRLIRAKIGEGVNVKQVLEEMQVSRSTFERRFRAHLGATPYDYILRCRVERVRQLLVDTNYPLKRVAQMTGFRGISHMTAVFRERTGVTPGHYRQGT